MRALFLFILFASFPFSGFADNMTDTDSQTTELLQQLATDHPIGSEDAPITIIEYASLSCSHCANFHKETYPTIKERYIDTGKVRLLFRDFPLNTQALYASKLTHCIDDTHFEKFIKILFDTQSSWAYHRNYIEILSNITKLAGYSSEDIDACLGNKDLEALILEQRLKAANVLNVNNTPTFFIDGELFKDMTLQSLTTILDKKLSLLEK